MSRSLILLPGYSDLISISGPHTHTQAHSHKKYLAVINYYFSKQPGESYGHQIQVTCPEKNSDQWVAYRQPISFIHVLFLPVLQPDFFASVLQNETPIIAFLLLVLFCYSSRQILDILPLGDLETKWYYSYLHTDLLKLLIVCKVWPFISKSSLNCLHSS